MCELCFSDGGPRSCSFTFTGLSITGMVMQRQLVLHVGHVGHAGSTLLADYTNHLAAGCYAVRERNFMKAIVRASTGAHPETAGMWHDKTSGQRDTVQVGWEGSASKIKSVVFPYVTVTHYVTFISQVCVYTVTHKTCRFTSTSNVVFLGRFLFCYRWKQE